MRIAVTGGAGFIGVNLCRHLTERSGVTEVIVLDDLSTGNISNLVDTDIKFRRGSVLSDEDLDVVFKGVDAVIHLGAIPSVPRSVKAPVASHDANATGTLKVLEAARRHDVGHVVVASSSSVYGSNQKLPKHELDWTRPMSPYAVSKLAAEAYALAYQATYGLSVTAFRFFNVYGPGQAANHAYAAVVPRFLDAALRGQSLPIEGDGYQSRDFTYVETVASVLWLAVRDRVTTPQPVNLAWGTNTTLLELVDLIEQTLGRDVGREYLPARIGDVRTSQADPSTLKSLFPEAEEFSLQEGLRRTADWMQASMSQETTE